MIGLVSFGGGYAMIVPIGHEVVAQGWMTESEFTDAIAIAGMAPGPVAANSAVFVGYKVAGWAGAAISTLGIILPSLVLIILAAAFFAKLQNNGWVRSAFYGLRAVVTGLVFFGAIRFGVNSGMFGGEGTVSTLASLAIFGGALFALAKLKMHPLAVILLSSLVGIAVYT